MEKLRGYEEGDCLKGIVIQNENKYFTFLREVFLSIDNIQKKYNWLITNYECYPQLKKNLKILSNDYCWITGEDLTAMIESENFQWIWGVFSAFPQNISKDIIMQYEFPEADGNERLWKNPIILQHPLAEIEIIAWDSTMTIFISREDSIANMLQKKFNYSVDLVKYNSPC